MKKIVAVLVVAGFMVALLGGPGHAGKGAPMTIREKIEDQQMRIDEGVRSGQLTPREAKEVQGNLNHIKGMIVRMRSDGDLDPRERKKIQQLLDENSALIFREKHDAKPVVEAPKAAPAPVREQKAPPMTIREKIDDQQRRVDEGVRSGQLNRREAATVQDNLNHIKGMIVRMRSDGDLDPRERKKINDMLDENSRMIFKERHDFRRVY